MRDRETGYLVDYKIFIYGILLGVFALFASIIWNIIRDYENKMRDRPNKANAADAKSRAAD